MTDKGSETDWKARLRDATQKAVGKKWPMAHIGREIGASRQQVYAFLNSGVLGSDYLRKLEVWLSGHGFLPPSPSPATHAISPREAKLLKRLECLTARVDILEEWAYVRPVRVLAYQQDIALSDHPPPTNIHARDLHRGQARPA